MADPIAQFSGLASGIDSKSLIDAVIAARQLANDKRRSEIDYYSGQNDALESLNTKLLALNDLIDPLRSANQGGLSKKAASSDATVATATVGSNANNASYGLTVTSAANSSTGSFNQTYSSGSSFVSTAGSGTVTVTVGTGSDQVVINASVTVNSTTVDGLVSAINADPNASGRVVASAINTGTSASPSYKIVLTTLQQGTAKGTLALSASAPITELQTNTIDPATNAVFSISGITGSITRDSNSIDDVVSGVTFNVLKAGTSTINVVDDPDTTSDKISRIVDAYNEIVKYISDNDQIKQDSKTSDRTVTFGSLAKTRVDNDFLSFFRSNISSATSASGTAVTTMAELGIKTNRDGTLTFDEDAFKSAVSSDPIGVGEVLNSFADAAAGVSGSIYQFTKLEGFIDNAESANNDRITNLNSSIDQLNRQTDKIKAALQQQFANLETVTSKLQSSQSALSGILAGIR
ncbi:MAG: flagellar filament capping protein FliD [Bdellovibrionota bacterium]